MVKRSVLGHETDRKGSVKRAKYDVARSEPRRLASAEDVRTALANQDPNGLNEVLINLRNQLTVRPEESALTPQDERLLFVKDWLGGSPAARDIFLIIEGTPQPSPNIISLCINIVSLMLNLLSMHFIYHALGKPIIKILLSPSTMRQLNSNLSSTNSEIILSTLKLLNSISKFAGGVEQRSLMDGFAWNQKSLQKLLFMRRKGKSAWEIDSTGKPGLCSLHDLYIRTLFVFFILSFLSKSTPTPIKLLLLEQHRDTFLLIFKGLQEDSYSVARFILETCWEGVWNDLKIKRTLKIGLFNELTLNHIMKLYTRDSSEDEDSDHIPADLAHHFMLALCTRPGTGVCFQDHGWYPREQSQEESQIAGAEVDDDDVAKPHRGKIYNKILSNIIKGLKVNEDARQQELAFKIFEACPELVTGYWSVVNLTLEPRLSSRWITNISVLGTIVSLPVPTSSFLLLHSTQYNPCPPPLPSMLANVLPSVLTKIHLTRGLQATSSLVQHCTALALSKCLIKLKTVVCSLREVAEKLGENESSGQWLKRSQELEGEVEKRVPDYMVVVAMVQQKQALALDERDTTKGVLLSESALRLLWLYHKLFPRLVAEVRFDLGRLLMSVINPLIDKSLTNGVDSDIPVEEVSSGMDVLRQLHVLRLLKESDQFIWSNKSGSSSHSYLYIMFMLYAKTLYPALHNATSDLLTYLLSSSIIFSHDPLEFAFWLGALPSSRRALNRTAPDGTILSDESVGVLTFLDDCIQRCMKTPYRYLGICQGLFAEFMGEGCLDDALLPQHNLHTAASPLIVTVLEQLRAKLSTNLLSQSDTLAITTFIRKLICNMTCKQPDLRFTLKIAERFNNIFVTHGIVLNSVVVRDAIKRECDLLTRALQFIGKPAPCDPPPSSSQAVQDFLTQMEAVLTPPSNAAAANTAYELIDWMRLIHTSFHGHDIKRLFKIILRLWPPATKEFINQLDPSKGQLWFCNEDDIRDLEKYLSFEWAYWHTTSSQIADNSMKNWLASLFFSKSAWSSCHEHRIRIVMHRLAFMSKGQERSLRHAQLSLLKFIILQGHKQTPEVNLDPIKRAIFVESIPIRELCCSREITPTELAELATLVKISLNPQTSDSALAVEYCTYWLEQLDSTSNLQSCAHASLWIPFMEPIGVIQYLDVAITAIADGHRPTSTDQGTLESILETLVRFRSMPQLLAGLRARSHGIFTLRPHLRQKSALDKLLILVMEAGLPLGYNGFPLSLMVPCSISEVTSLAQERWGGRVNREVLDLDLTSALLQSGNWNAASSQMISGAIYRSPEARQIFWTWLAQSTLAQGLSPQNVVTALHSCLDVMSLKGSVVTQIPDVWLKALTRCIVDHQSAKHTRILCASCIRTICETSPSNLGHYAKALLEVMPNSCSDVEPLLALLVRDLHRLDATIFSPLLCKVGENVLQWMYHAISNVTPLDKEISIFEELTAMISLKATNLKPHLVELVLKAVIQSYLTAPRIVQCVIPLVSSTHLKPVIINRLLQSVVQHSQLYRLTDPTLSTREPIIKLLHTLFYIHPTNTCQPSHISPLACLYGGTMSMTDRLLLSVFHLYETQRKESTAAIFRHWYPSPLSMPSQDAFAAITNLDPLKVFRTCTTFPTRRPLDATVVGAAALGDEDVYDPVFLTLLAWELLGEFRRLSTAEWVQLFRSNIVSLLMCTLTSRDGDFRAVGRSTLGGILQKVHEGHFLEKSQVVYIMDMLRDLLPSPSAMSTHPTPRLPILPVSLLAHALRSTFYPSSFLYPITSRFLLQRPEVDASDVPMLYAMLYSSDDAEWTKERMWMIRFLTDAVREGGRSDWAILKRRHTWDLIASIWQATRLEEKTLRKAILEFLANLSANPHIIMPLILHSSLLSWIEMQLQAGVLFVLERRAWIKILENIVVTVSRDKADRLTYREFSTAIVRCLDLVLGNIKKSEGTDSLPLLHLISRVFCRVVTGLSASPDIMMVAVLGHAVKTLQELETAIDWTTTYSFHGSLRPDSPLEVPHHARGLFDLSGTDNKTEFMQWCECVCSLWKVSMSLGYSEDEKKSWNALTCRVLVIRASGICDLQTPEMELGEWARREAVRCLISEEENN